MVAEGSLLWRPLRGAVIDVTPAIADLGLLRLPPAQLEDPEELGADSPCVLYRLRGTPRGEEVLAQTKNAWRQPHIPGSSLKGAIRTVLLWEAVRTGRVQVRLRPV